MMKKIFLFLMLGIVLSVGVSANQVDIGASLNVEEYEWGLKNLVVTQNVVPTAGQNTTISVNFTIYHDLGVSGYINENEFHFGTSADIDFLVANPTDNLTTNEFIYGDQNLSNCVETQINSTEFSYVCNIDIPYWSSAGEYKAFLEITNSLPNSKTYTETTMVQEVSNIDASALVFHWTSVTAGNNNQYADANITLSNLGNVAFISSTLTGSNMNHSTETDIITADSFSVNSVTLAETSVALGVSVAKDYVTSFVEMLHSPVVGQGFITAPQTLEASVNMPYVIGGTYTSVTDWVLSLATN